MNILWFTLPAIVLLGIVTSYQDLKFGRISNKWLKIAFFYGLLLFFVFISTMYVRDDDRLIYYSLQFLGNILVTATVSIVLWNYRFWSAGDAKLFITYSLLIPLSFYLNGYMNFFPSFSILVNTFVPFLLFYSYNLIMRSSKSSDKKIIGKIFKPKFLLENSLYAFVFFWIGSISLPYIDSLLPQANNTAIFVLLLFGLVYVISKMNINTRILSLTFAGIALFVSKDKIFTLPFLINYSIVLFLLVFLRNFLISASNSIFSRSIWVEDLEEGMILAENYKRKGKFFLKVSAEMNSKDKSLIIKNPFSGITKAESKKVKLLHSEGKIKDHSIYVHQVIPFAPFLFLGVLITLVFQGNAFMVLASLL